MTTVQEEKLIQRHVRPDPNRPGADEVRLVDTGVRLWAIVGDYLAADGDIDQVVKDYGLAHEAVEAALFYYKRHKDVIDNRLAANAVALGG
jgi:uncharacterized protein (DUF433 family)